MECPMPRNHVRLPPKKPAKKGTLAPMHPLQPNILP